MLQQHDDGDGEDEEGWTRSAVHRGTGHIHTSTLISNHEVDDGSGIMDCELPSEFFVHTFTLSHPPFAPMWIMDQGSWIASFP